MHMQQRALRGALISFLILAEPAALAAQEIRPAHHREVQSAVFAGASLTLPLGHERASRPRARLQLSTIHTSRDLQSASPQRTYVTQGLELGLSRSGRLDFSIGGRNGEELQRRLGVKDDTTTWIIVGGVAVVAIVVVALATSGGCLAPSMTRDC